MPPVNDSKATELAKLKAKLIEMEGQLKEEKKITAKLRDNSEKKIQLSMSMDAEIATEVESFKWKREKSLAERDFLTQESKKMLSELGKREMEIKLATAEFDLVMYENDLLHNMIKEVSNEQLRSAAVQTKEQEKKAQRNFDARIELEDVHRQTILSFNNGYQKEAITKMELEASQANAENDRIYTEFDIREDRTNMLIRQQQLSYDQLMHVKIERDVVAVSVELQEKDISELTKQNATNSTELTDLQAEVERVREGNRQLRISVAQKRQIMKQLDDLRAQLAPIVEQSESLKTFVTSFCSTLLHEGLEIGKKERIFQSSQIATTMNKLSSDRTRTPQTPQTPQTPYTPSPYASYVSPRSEVGGDFGVESFLENEGTPREKVDAEAIWKAGASINGMGVCGGGMGMRGSAPAQYITANAAAAVYLATTGSGPAALERNLIRRRLTELMHIRNRTQTQTQEEAQDADEDGVGFEDASMKGNTGNVGNVENMSETPPRLEARVHKANRSSKGKKPISHAAKKSFSMLT